MTRHRADVDRQLSDLQQAVKDLADVSARVLGGVDALAGLIEQQQQQEGGTEDG